METRRYLQLISLAISSVSAVALTLYTTQKKYWQVRYLLIAPTLWFIHVTIYYTAIFLFSGSDLDQSWFHRQMSFNTWSSGVNIHAAITMVVLSWAIANLINNLHKENG